MKKTVQKIILCLANLSFIASAIAQTEVLPDSIITDRTLTADKIYIMQRDVIVKNGATLTIEPGTIIRGEKATIGRLIITRSGKIHAVGTSSQPIIFTSNQPKGQRAPGDWGGIAIIGNAPSNSKDAGGNPTDLRLECGTNSNYDGGGTNSTDNSGIMQYVRIEFAGVACALNKELNSLTLLCVGSGTTIDHIQCSYGGDDSYEWFGGNVNMNYLIAYKGTDDDFDTDNGYSGKVQFGWSFRDPSLADVVGASNGFESDNDANATNNTPFTSAVFSNMTIIHPYQTPTTTVGADAYFGAGALLRRNTKLKIFNSIILGCKYGLRIDDAATNTNALNNDVEFKHNLIGGCKYRAAYGNNDSVYIANGSNAVRVLSATSDVMLTAPYAQNPTPQTGSPALTDYDFSSPSLNGFSAVNYVGAFNQNDNWATSWTNFDPQNEDYSQPLAIEEKATMNFSLFPNPNEGSFTITFKNSLSETQNIGVYNAFGQLVASKELEAGQTVISFTENNLEKGVYFVCLLSEKNRNVAKVIVK